MPSYMLDTNICIYIRQKQPESVLRRFARMAPGDAVLSSITYGELLYGANKSQSRESALSKLRALTSFLGVLEVTPDAAENYGDIRADLVRRGEVIGGNDLWIAAHARSAGLTLVTNKEREFRRVKGLKVQNWVA